MSETTEKKLRHLAIIMDGNGRWAKQRHQPRLFGHRAGMKALHNTVRSASNLGIEVLTVYAFSTENWKRSREEVDGLMKIAVEYFFKEIDELNAENVKIQIIGDVAGLPEEVREAAENAMTKTADNTGMVFNVALNYGGRDEMVRAMRQIINDGFDAEEITEELISEYLYTKGLPDPDILLRTGGEKRLSNFLLWQSSYSEIFFDDIWWPDFDEEALKGIIAQFEQRDRRYGGVKG